MATKKKKINWKAYNQKLINKGVVKALRLATSSRRLGKSELKLSEEKREGRSGKVKENIYVVVDSAGLKIFREGEWKLCRHTYSKRQAWKKLRLSVDEKDSELITVSLTDN